MKRGFVLPIAAVLLPVVLCGSLLRPTAEETPKPGTIVTIAGTGAAGYSGDHGPATSARLLAPAGLAVDTAGNLFIAEFGNHRLRKVSSTGIITTVAGKGAVGDMSGGFSGDGGPAIDARLNLPVFLAFDGAGNLFVTEWGNNRVRRIAVDGIISTVAGSGPIGEGTGSYSGDGSLATEARLNGPLSPATDAEGNLYISDGFNHRVRKVGLDGSITTIAGNGTRGQPSNGALATQEPLGVPHGLVKDEAGNLLIADQFNHRVYQVGPDGIISTVAGTGPTGFDEGGYAGDGGPAKEARFNYPRGLAMDTAGNLFITDVVNSRVRKVSPDGTIITIAGGGKLAGRLGDGGPATEVRLVEPSGVAVDGQGNLYFSEIGANRVRKVFGVAAPGLIAGKPFPKP